MKTLLTVAFINIYTITWAQRSSVFETGLTTDHGIILKHSSSIGHLITHYPRALTFFANQPLLGQKPWHQIYNFPKRGIAFTFFDFGNPTIGKSLALHTSFFIPLFQHQYFKNHQWHIEIGTGIVYATNPFDIEKNYLNNILSSRISSIIQVGFYYQYYFLKEWGVQAGLRLTHYSNASAQLPNKGINIFTINTGVVKKWNSTQTMIQPSELPGLPSRKWKMDIAIMGGRSKSFINQPTKDIIINLSAYGGIRPNRLSYWQAGLDVSWHTGIKRQIERFYRNSSQTPPDYRRLGIMAGHELFVGKMSLLIQAGYYIYRQYNSLSDLPIYQRYGLKYYITPKMFANLNLKTHAAVAESLEFALGYSL